MPTKHGWVVFMAKGTLAPCWKVCRSIETALCDLSLDKLCKETVSHAVGRYPFGYSS